MFDWLKNQSIEELSAVAERLSKGDYSARIHHLSNDPEFGRLSQAINLLADRIQNSITELSEEKAQLSTILSNMVEAVVAVDEAGTILEFNPAFSKLMGIDPKGTIGKPFVETIRNSDMGHLMTNTLKDLKPRVEEVQVVSPEERFFEAHSVPLKREGKKTGALLVLHDITRIRNLEQMRRDFVANVSHELRTPLSSIKGYAETLRSGGMKDKKNRDDFLKTIEKHADNMTRLVEDLLQLSSIESGVQAPELEAVAILDVAKEVSDSLKPLCKKKNISITIEKNENIPTLAFDRTQMKQVFTNLIQNAIKFNKDGGTIQISAEANNQFLTVSVKDSGIGIHNTHKDRLFERFYRVDQARSREEGGTGLGLSIVKHIVEAHKGRISVESQEGQGSTFNLVFPR